MACRGVASRVEKLTCIETLSWMLSLTITLAHRAVNAKIGQLGQPVFLCL